ncbi:MAG: calcium/sodium antiporter [Rhodospirillaceae bacterium]|jgi:cation:H+ antiporter|nr:calcium/sodium antiporter [Rhodospirillaceae bacterium]MBT5243585.1 calcium/sodium antiporter [Rhodospirillaceae bacterium]MBT5562173.1 calcium/sodium antiporter [Rhodospirillaceae bacterium]MBT6242346.1 calcium/sodium antiporter [Rhodospirillaceae bacterium]MBT7138948.1 calcium/sodium antiporter [Rhodospirillaceae bacterium]
MMYLKVLLGFVFLLGSADILVRGAVGLARRLDISPLIIGMTVIAFGTSAPELLVSMDAALSGSPAMALGNVIGSNMANMLLILGSAALFMPISIQPYALKNDAVMLLVASALFGWFCWSGPIGSWQGVVLIVLLAGFLIRAYLRDSRDGGVSAEIHVEEVKDFEGITSLKLIWMAILAGLAGVVFGADMLVDGGVDLARTFGVAEEVIGLTVLAFGTSLPELAASIVAALRGHTEVALGNVVGSNLFNVLAVIGTVALVTPLQAPAQLLDFDLWIMLGTTIVLMPFLMGGWRIGRVTAVAFLSVYGAYIFAQAYGVSAVLEILG